MKRIVLILTVSGAIALGVTRVQQPQAPIASRPNIVLIMRDRKSVV